MFPTWASFQTPSVFAESDSKFISICRSKNSILWWHSWPTTRIRVHCSLLLCIQLVETVEVQTTYHHTITQRWCRMFDGETQTRDTVPFSIVAFIAGNQKQNNFFLFFNIDNVVGWLDLCFTGLWEARDIQLGLSKMCTTWPKSNLLLWPDMLQGQLCNP